MNAIPARTALMVAALFTIAMTTALGADLRASLNGDGVSPGDSEVAYTFVYSIWGQPDFATGERAGAAQTQQASTTTGYSTGYASFPTFSTRATDYWFTNVADADPLWLAYLSNTKFVPTPLNGIMPSARVPQAGSQSGTPLWALMDGYASPGMSTVFSSTGQIASFSFDTSLGTFPVTTSSSAADSALVAQGLSGSGDGGSGDFIAATGFVGPLGFRGSSSTGTGTSSVSGGTGAGGTGAGGSGGTSGGFSPIWPTGGGDSGGSGGSQPTNTGGNDSTGGTGSTPEAATILLLFATALPYVGHKLRHRHDDEE